MNPEIISQLIRNRKSTFINGLKERGKINNSVIENILENAVWAPSHGLTQSWFFKVFADDGIATFFSVQ
ncbi:MAG: nitroreductase family protein [Bacteroidales bacterium]|nr:nitroreductase family protein [Bacteroidales bacterium]